jgi:hypothetical protein
MEFMRGRGECVFELEDAASEELRVQEVARDEYGQSDKHDE